MTLMTVEGLFEKFLRSDR